jgi:hypothetical protein
MWRASCLVNTGLAGRYAKVAIESNAKSIWESTHLYRLAGVPRHWDSILQLRNRIEWSRNRNTQVIAFRLRMRLRTNDNGDVIP